MTKYHSIFKGAHRYLQLEWNVLMYLWIFWYVIVFLRGEILRKIYRKIKKKISFVLLQPKNSYNEQNSILIHFAGKN